MTMKPRAIISAVILGALLSSGFVAPSRAAAPLKLHPENPHFVVYRGRPTVLVASTEHYGAVLNRDFDFRPYLDELKTAGLNYTRAFSGVYSEPWGEPFNTLNPPRGRLLAPWARGATPGYVDGGNKFDLNRWDDAYFKRLREFIGEAAKRGVVVELTLFCNWYDDNQWHLSPLYSRNNVNGVGDRHSKQVNSLQSGDVLAHQEAMVRKIVAAVNDLENVFFEVCNEPGAEGAWMDHMAEVIWATEGRLPNRHLIASNDHPVPHMAIFNTHYDRDCAFVRANYGRNIVVGYDETGFDGASDLPYRRQGWRFLLNGGGLYDNLDWSFSVAHPDGTETKWEKKLGGGSPALRRQLGILRAFLEGFDLPRLKPDRGVVKGGAPGNFSVLAEPGKQYAIYLDGGNRAELQLDLPAGDYVAEWIDTRSGAKSRTEHVSGGGVRTLKSPGYAGDIALRILRKGPVSRGRKILRQSGDARTRRLAFDPGTARGYSAHGGRWDGGQVIPEWFVDQTAARSQPGSGGEPIAFVPSLDLVVARQPGSSGGWEHEGFPRRACAAVVETSAEKPAPATSGARVTAGTVLGVRDTRFTLGGEPTFLLGMSDYGALGAPEDSLRRDLDDLARHGFNWVRVWATWRAFDRDVSAVDAEGRPREPFLGRLRSLVAECDRRGLVVDVTLTRGDGTNGGAIPNLQAHRRAVETLVVALKAHRNWYLDLANERDIRDARHVPARELEALRDQVRTLDPTRLVTASFGGHDLGEADLREAMLTIGLDFVAPHRPRDAGSPGQTEARTRECLATMRAIGRSVPVHYQEPFRRGYDRWQPTARDFLTDLRGAVAGGAAGWCLHNGSSRGAPEERPRRSFDLHARRLFDQLDEVEREVVARAAAETHRAELPRDLELRHHFVSLDVRSTRHSASR